MLKFHPIVQKVYQPIIGFFLAFIGLLSVQSCENIHNNQDDEIETHEAYLIFQNQLFSIYEIIEEIADQTTPQGLPDRWKSPMLPKNLKIEKKDSSYLDGDGVEFEVDFGDWDANVKMPLGLDEKVKAGKLKVKIDKFYQEIGSEMKVEFDNSDPFVIGDSMCPQKWQGEIEFVRLDYNIMKVISNSLQMNATNGSKSATCDLKIERISGVGTPGIFEDTYKVTGKVDANIENDDFLTISINSPLLKRVEWGCSSSPLKGILVIQGDKEENKQGVTVDFDPFNNEACDDWVRLQFAGKTKDFKIPMNP